jgi:D-aspartate ligase
VPASACAVVVGLCAHGLAISRALHGAGIKVVALEANESLPGTRTKCAEVRIVPDINGVGLVDTLIRLAPTLGGAHRPVLFLTNDRMVETIGTHAESFADCYHLSWAGSRDAILPLLRKDQIESRCRATGLNYPRTRLIAEASRLAQDIADLRFPLIVKPTKPISAFKTIVADSLHSLLAARGQIAQSLPAIVQEFVPGDDRSIRFGVLYLDEGEIVARFEGRKLRSRPMGHTTIAVSERDDAIHALTARFYDGLGISGPVSLELKRGSDGTEWVIEPTVGRTDFWVGLCIANNVDLPLIEYMQQARAGVIPAVQRDTHVWVNGERDPGAVAWLLANSPRTLLGRRVQGVYASADDSAPFMVALARYVGALPARAARRARRLMLSP